MVQETESSRMPTLFVGHGSPVNAIEDNRVTRAWRKIADEMPRPKAILSVSAHWYISHTLVCDSTAPRTIHDFYGFPEALYAEQYPAPGAPDIARQIQNLVKSTHVESDSNWGLDHGTWSVLKQMYPEADIPTTQISIDYTKSAHEHYAIGKDLSKLREEGVLILASGNLVHNLRELRIDRLDFGYEWTKEFDRTIVDYIESGNHKGVVEYEKLGSLAQLAHPIPDHYLPLLYALGASSKSEEADVFNRFWFAGSISMTCMRIG